MGWKDQSTGRIFDSLSRYICYDVKWVTLFVWVMRKKYSKCTAANRLGQDMPRSHICNIN